MNQVWIQRSATAGLFVAAAVIYWSIGSASAPPVPSLILALGHNDVPTLRTIQALGAGGNAVDASLAAILVLCVIQPASLGVGGYGGTCVIYLADQQKSVAINFDSRAPAAFNVDLLQGDPRKPCTARSR